jgi:hypothetical protein
MRKVFFQFFPDKYPPETGIDARLARIFANGEQVHVRLGGYIASDPNVTFRDEINVPIGDVNVHGRCDGVVRLDGQTYILEFKSIHQRVVYEPKSEHVGQLMYYLHQFEQKRKLLREEFGLAEGDIVVENESTMVMKGNAGRCFAELDDVEKDLLLSFGELKGEIIYESKASQDLFSFPLSYDEEKAKEVLMWFRTMQDHIDKQDVPVVHYDKSRFPCQWGSGKSVGRCPYWELCYGTQKTLPMVPFEESNENDGDEGESNGDL